MEDKTPTPLTAEEIRIRHLNISGLKPANENTDIGRKIKEAALGAMQEFALQQSLKDSQELLELKREVDRLTENSAILENNVKYYRERLNDRHLTELKIHQEQRDNRRKLQAELTAEKSKNERLLEALQNVRDEYVETRDTISERVAARASNIVKIIDEALSSYTGEETKKEEGG